MTDTTIDLDYRLDQNLSATSGRIFLTGTQALVRMLLSRKRADAAAGLHTAGFVTGYRGSPLAGVDTTMWRHREALDAHKVSFMPAINEDLAATIVMGTQQAGARADREVDGVFAMWYGKGPGVDRAGDAIHHGHAAGASRHGGVLMIVGDDHTAASSSIPHASEHSLKAWSVPIIHPASIDEYERFGLWGWELSRYSGAWVAFKAVTETVESGRAFQVKPLPAFTLPARTEQEESLEYNASTFLSPAIEHQMARRVDAVRAFARLNPLDELVDPAPEATLGIISTGKAFLDVTEALAARRGSGEALPAIRHLKIGLAWPIDRDTLLNFAAGLEHILVIEEKASFVETQVRELLYDLPQRPGVSGKTLATSPLVPEAGQLSPALVGTAMERWLGHVQGRTPASTKPGHDAPAARAAPPLRKPYFCSGCPHNTSTRVPEGSEALAGVGCHYMASWMDRNTHGLTQMGGEGTDWIGLSRYTRAGHIFQNMGEGTYFHSGYLAIRQAIAANANITYKILFNDAVAMTGGQPVDGRINVPGICQQLAGEGVKRIVVTTDDPSRYRGVRLPDGVKVHHRRELDALQRELAATPGVTALIHDQVCAAEKRRRSKKDTTLAPTRRVVINEAVCEGCGDCTKQSNCLSVVPVSTPFGQKRRIDQSSCNTDFSCVDGFCPSFVSVVGGKPRRSAAESALSDARVQELLATCETPVTSAATDTCNILVAGIGGTGVITVGAILTMAAHLEGRATAVLDITGLAQKGGSVVSHVRLGTPGTDPATVRIPEGQADVALLCDLLAGTHDSALQTYSPQRTQVVLNTYIAPSAATLRKPDAPQDTGAALSRLQACTDTARRRDIDAHAMAERHFGDTLYANMILLGHAWQQGLIPVSLPAIHRALELNGVAADTNRRAFALGRLAAAKPEALSAHREDVVTIHRPEPAHAVIEMLEKSLEAYQDTAYARRFRRTIDAVVLAEKALYPSREPRLATQAARSLHRLMAYKDEYEVARQLSSDAFKDTLRRQFEGDFSLRFHLAPPGLTRRDPATGKPRKIEIGQWALRPMNWLARMRAVRGTWFDPFGYTAERRRERRLIREFEQALAGVSRHLSKGNYAQALELAALPQSVRGYGHVKEATVAPFRKELKRLSAAFGDPSQASAGQLQGT